MGHNWVPARWNSSQQKEKVSVSSRAAGKPDLKQGNHHMKKIGERDGSLNDELGLPTPWRTMDAIERRRQKKRFSRGMCAAEKRRSRARGGAQVQTPESFLRTCHATKKDKLREKCDEWLSEREKVF